MHIKNFTKIWHEFECISMVLLYPELKLKSSIFVFQHYKNEIMCERQHQEHYKTRRIILDPFKCNS